MRSEHVDKPRDRGSLTETESHELPIPSPPGVDNSNEQVNEPGQTDSVAPIDDSRLKSATQDTNEIVTNPKTEVGDSVQKELAIDNINQEVTTVEGNLMTSVGNTVEQELATKVTCEVTNVSDLVVEVGDTKKQESVTKLIHVAPLTENTTH